LMTALIHGLAPVEALAQVAEAKGAAAEVAEAVMTTTIGGAGVVDRAPADVVAVVVAMPEFKLLSMNEPKPAGAVTSPLQTRFATS